MKQATHTFQSGDTPPSWYDGLPVWDSGKSDMSGLLVFVTIPMDEVRQRIVNQYGEADRHIADDNIAKNCLSDDFIAKLGLTGDELLLYAERSELVALP